MLYNLDNQSSHISNILSLVASLPMTQWKSAFDCFAPTGVYYFICPWTLFLSINPFDLQLKLNSESIFPSDFYYVKSFIGFPFGDSQTNFTLQSLWRQYKWQTKNKLKFVNVFLTFVFSSGKYLLFGLCMYFSL
jgi:hypothetical protein